MSRDGAVSLRDVRKLETRKQIQDAARELIAEHGFERTTMRMLAKTAGVGLGTVSLHFKDKESLLLASFYEEIGSLALEAIAVVPDDIHVGEQIRSIVGTLYRYYAANTGYLRSVVRVALFIRGEWRERFDAQVTEVVTAASSLFEAGKARGEVKPGVDAFQAGYACWSLYLTMLVEGLNAEEFDADVQLAKFGKLLDVMLGGILV